MRPVSYRRAESVAAATALVTGNPSAAFVAGGTELLNWLKDGLYEPELLVDVGRLRLDDIDLSDDLLRIGAGASMSDVAANEQVRTAFPLLAQALEAGASPQLRNMATIGGNLLQKTRCAYFREASFPCDKRVPGTGCSARDGDHSMHAILDTNRACIAVHPSDLAVALLALDASVLTASADGSARTIEVDDFYLAIGDDPRPETVLRHGELIVGVELPAGPRSAASRYLKVRERASFGFALVSVAAAVEFADGVVRSARIALGGVAHRPWRARAAERALLDRTLTAESIAAASTAAVEAAAPLPGTRYKVTLAQRAVSRILEELGEVI